MSAAFKSITFVWLISLLSAEIDYLSGNCSLKQPACLHYHNDCSACDCNADGTIACSDSSCLGTSFCDECEEGYWIAFNTFQPPGYPTCDSRFLRSPTFLEDNSKCACPSSFPYYVPQIGCVAERYCDAVTAGRNGRQSDVFRFTAPPQNGRCPYEYQLCTSSGDCAEGLVCNVPKSNYETCVPLAARFDNDCNLVTNCPQCVPDCMGSGYGYCVAPEIETTIAEQRCEVGGCNSEICAIDGSELNSICSIQCEHQCLQYETCGFDVNGRCTWQTNLGQEKEYQTCIDSCSNVCSGCVNPFTGECNAFLPPCARREYCYRPLDVFDTTQPMQPLTCTNYPDAVCKFSGCICGEYFEDVEGNIYTLQECDAIISAP